MTVAARRGYPAPLRVVVRAAHSARREALTRLVVAAGHRVAEAAEGEIALLDDTADPPPGLPAIGLGGDAEHAGLLAADASALQLDAALRAVAAGLLVRMPGLPAGFAALDDPGPLLTPREVQVLALIGQGCSNKAVARHLDISQHTVKFHLEAVFAKLGVRTRAEAVASGLRRELVEV